MTLAVRCRDCDFCTEWEGGPASEDPAVQHTKETGHTVSTWVGGEGDGDVPSPGENSVPLGEFDDR